MIANRSIIPENPLKYIQECVKDQKIVWTYHVNMRMKGRFIPRKFILDSVENYQIIEEYPKDKYFPSYLVYSCCPDAEFHILFAADVEGDNVRIITAYIPNINDWEKGLKKRRRSL